jgi:hypothetical protein
VAPAGRAGTRRPPRDAADRPAPPAPSQDNKHSPTIYHDLQERGLIRRQPDPGDRRAHLLSLTSKGRRVRETAQAAIRRGEERLLARLAPGDRRGFLRALQALSALSPGEIVGEQ